MKTILISILLLGISPIIHSQPPTTAYDFTMDDCNGKMHHLFSELDSGNVVVMEYFMLSCSSCIVAGHSLDAMMVPLKNKYGNKVRFYQFGFTKSYTCTQIKNWISTNGFASSVPFDSGDVQVAYYGGMGMPTIAVVGGLDHKILFSSLDFKPTTDTADISKSIHDFFGTTGIGSHNHISSNVFIYPNPVTGNFTLAINAEKPGVLKLTIYSLEGQQIAILPNENVCAGAWSKIIRIPFLKSGTYLINGECGNEKFIRKITILNNE